MNSTIKAGLLASVSAAAISLSLVAPAHAFDNVNWQWDATITEQINKNVNINIDMTPTGLVMVESLQAHIGDVTATSDVDGITNTQPGAGGEIESAVIPFQFHYGAQSNLGVVVIEDSFKSPPLLTANVNEQDEIFEGSPVSGTVTGTITVEGVVIPATATLDAVTELPSVASAATAVGNNLSVDSEVGAQLHIGQFLIGDASGESSSLPNVSTGNSNLTIAAALASLVQGGSLTKSTVEAKSTVSNILNATVDSAATAVANNVSVAVAPASASNGFIIGDVVQFAYADVSAKSKVTDVTVANYSGLGSLGRPVVNSVATAVGNNASISVKTPVVAAP